MEQGKITYQRQSRLESMVEQLGHLFLSIIMTVIILGIFFPQIPIISNITATVVLTVVKYFGHYGIRRYFSSRQRGY